MFNNVYLICNLSNENIIFYGKTKIKFDKKKLFNVT